ncbi:tetratricopeptide repeat protein [Nocardiopsis alba]|uniref:Tetratricopeptide repeat protein n=1 Tax=Nocardiopsis alba TaxID=53437 RepID=A0ABV5DXF8_9ACTN
MWPLNASPHDNDDTGVLPTDRNPTNWPIRAGAVPLPRRSTHFQEREIGPVLDEALSGFGHPTDHQVLTGPSGVGKTRLAAHHARSLLGERGGNLLVWADASDREGVVFAYAHAARRLLSHCPEDPELAAGRFLDRLRDPSSGSGRRWLVVWDDLTDPARVEDLWPPSGREEGRTIVTTRLPARFLPARGRRPVEVDVYSEAEAAGFLRTALTESGIAHTADEAAALATGLDRLPLALSQAVAYMADRGTTCADYLELLREHPGSTGPWELALERADAHRPSGIARPLLGLLCLLSPSATPEQVLVSRPFREHLGRRVSPPRRPAEQEIRLALASLERLHLIDRGTPLVIGTHHLSRRAAREHPLTRPDREGTRAVADALVSVSSDGAPGSVSDQRVRSSVRSLLACPERRAWLWEGDPHPLLFRSAGLPRVDREGRALPYRDVFLESLSRDLPERVEDPERIRRGLEKARRHHTIASGPDGAATLRLRHALAYLRAWAGDPGGAIPLYRDLLIDLDRRLGPDRPETLSARGNLAVCRAESGDPTTAVEEARALLTDQRRHLGPDHPNTLTTLHNLAHWRGEAGDPQGAVTEFDRLVEVRAEVMGVDHPTTLACRHELACRRALAGDTEGAARDLAEVARDRRRVLGPGHPDTLATFRRLDRLRREIGVLAEETPNGGPDTLDSGARDEDETGGNGGGHELDPNDEPTGPHFLGRFRK